MAAFEKLLQRMRNNPRGNWTINNLLTISSRLGIEVRNSGGSHHVFSFPGIEEDVTVPFKRPISRFTLKSFLLWLTR
jgi:predicted RNA binding protein YcfA (HicA-like mRNA interferase family)